MDFQRPVSGQLVGQNCIMRYVPLWFKVLIVFWSGCTLFLVPFSYLISLYRLHCGKETIRHYRERRGTATLLRPYGKLIWLHAASVGEMLSLFPLIDALLEGERDLNLLLTTVTETSAEVFSKQNQCLFDNKRIIHQYMPLDMRQWTERFLDYWQPKLGIFTETELWPIILWQCRKRSLPLILVNGKLSDRSYKWWCIFKPILFYLSSFFDHIVARNAEDAFRFSALGVTNINLIGDLKDIVSPMPYSLDELGDLKVSTDGRPLWLAASTHAGEEEIILKAHLIVKRQFPALLTIIVPRHPERAKKISLLANHAPTRSQQHLPKKQDDIWIADTVGEMGLFYRLANIVFLGNSLPQVEGKAGGHNPMEPLRFGCIIATGPKVHNFRDVFNRLQHQITYVADAYALAEWIEYNLSKTILPKQRPSIYEDSASQRYMRNVLKLIKNTLE